MDGEALGSCEAVRVPPQAPKIREAPTKQLRARWDNRWRAARVRVVMVFCDRESRYVAAVHPLRRRDYHPSRSESRIRTIEYGPAAKREGEGPLRGPAYGSLSQGQALARRAEDRPPVDSDARPPRTESRISTIEYSRSVDDRIDDHDVSSLVRGSLRASGPIPEPMRAHARARPAKECAAASFAGNRSAPIAVGFRRRDGSLSPFPWNHEGSWLSASREGMCAFALFHMTIGPYECRPHGQGITPNACLAGPMSPDECSRDAA